MAIDVLTAGTAIFSFVIFLLVHVITFRRVAPEHLLRSLLMCTISIMALPVLMMAVFYMLKAADASLQAWVCAAVVSSLIQGLLCFVYVLCVFGPYETSVRMRLVREVARGGASGISLQDLLGRYNAETIVDVRLQRLVGSGDIIENNGLYRAGRTQNLFFVFDAVGGIIKKWIGR